MNTEKIKHALQKLIHHINKVQSETGNIIKISPTLIDDLHVHIENNSIDSIAPERWSGGAGISILIHEYDCWQDDDFHDDEDYEEKIEIIQSEFDDVFDELAEWLSSQYITLEETNRLDNESMDSCLVGYQYWIMPDDLKIKLFILWEDSDAPIQLYLEIYR